MTSVGWYDLSNFEKETLIARAHRGYSCWMAKAESKGYRTNLLSVHGTAVIAGPDRSWDLILRNSDRVLASYRWTGQRLRRIG